MKLIKAGESHGEAMTGILVGVPAGIPVDKEEINADLRERNFAYGRSGRQLAESDVIGLISGLFDGKTNGNDVALSIKNNVRAVSVSGEETPCGAVGALPPLTNLRPGHADLPGTVRFGFADARAVAEGASARNTCVDVAAGRIALSMLSELGISVAAFVRTVGKASDENDYSFDDVKELHAPFFTPSEDAEKTFRAETDKVAKNGDTVGGIVELRVRGVKSGIGSYTAESRVSGAIARDLFSIQSIKGVRFGDVSFSEGLYGSEYFDELQFDETAKRVRTSRSGGIDGGMTNGAEIKLSVAVKPLPTSAKGVPSSDVYGNKVLSAKERADVTAVFALCPILRARLAITLCDLITKDFGCDNLSAIAARYNAR